MVRLWSLSSSVMLSLSILLQKAASLQLEPIPPTTGLDNGRLEKRATASALELQNAETFLWGSGTGKSKVLDPPVLSSSLILKPRLSSTSSGKLYHVHSRRLGEYHIHGEILGHAQICSLYQHFNDPGIQ